MVGRIWLIVAFLGAAISVADEQLVKLKAIDLESVAYWEHRIGAKINRVRYAKYGSLLVVLGAAGSAAAYYIDKNATKEQIQSLYRSVSVPALLYDFQGKKIVDLAQNLVVSLSSTTLNIVAGIIIPPVVIHYYTKFLHLFVVPNSITTYDEQFTNCGSYLEQLGNDIQMIVSEKQVLPSDKEIIIITTNRVLRKLEQLLGFMRVKRQQFVPELRHEACLVEDRLLNYTTSFVDTMHTIITTNNELLDHIQTFTQRVTQELQRFALLEKE